MLCVWERLTRVVRDCKSCPCRFLDWPVVVSEQVSLTYFTGWLVREIISPYCSVRCIGLQMTATDFLTFECVCEASEALVSATTVSSFISSQSSLVLCRSDPLTHPFSCTASGMPSCHFLTGLFFSFWGYHRFYFANEGYLIGGVKSSSSLARTWHGRACSSRSWMDWFPQKRNKRSGFTQSFPRPFFLLWELSNQYTRGRRREGTYFVFQGLVEVVSGENKRTSTLLDENVDV